MIIKIFIKLILIILAVILQLSFVGNLPAWAGSINLIIVIAVFMVEFSGGSKNVFWFLLAGFLLDLYSPLFFGFWLVFWPITFLFSFFLSRYFFTNKSLYSFLGISFFTSVFYYLFSHLIFYASKIFIGDSAVFFIFVKDFYINSLLGACLNSAIVLVLFYFVNFASNRLKPVFLYVKKY